MPNRLLDIVAHATVASSCGILLTLLLRKQFRLLFGPGLAYFLWLLVPAALLALLLPAPNTSLKGVLGVPLSMPLLTSHIAEVTLSSGADWRMWVLCTWGIGALLFCWRLTHQQRRFIARLGEMIRGDGDVFRAADPNGGPVVVGILRPKIVVPSDFDTRYALQEQALILAHERMHVRRGDLVINAICALARCIFWFNPLAHVAGRAIRFDQELACDAAVMRNYPHSRKPYASAMLRTQLTDGALPLGCYWPSTHPLKERIMVLKQPPARGLRRVIGQTLVGICVASVGYGTWATQSDTESTGAAARVTYADSEIRISSDSVQSSEQGVRYTGNVILKIVGHQLAMQIKSNKISSPDDNRPNGSAPVIFEGNVQIKVHGRIFNTERALMMSKGIFKMDDLEVLQAAASETIPARY